MALEAGVVYIEDLVATNPDGAADFVDEGDDHIRNIKTAVKGSFPNLGAAAVTKTAAEINDLSTLTGSETLTNKTLTSPVFNTGVSGTAIDTDDTLAADSDTLLPSQQAVKAYVDLLTGPLLTLLSTPILLATDTSTSSTAKANIDITAHTTGVATKAIIRVQTWTTSGVNTASMTVRLGEADETFSAVHNAVYCSTDTSSSLAQGQNTIHTNLKTGEIFAWELIETGTTLSHTTTLHLVGYYV